MRTMRARSRAVISLFDQCVYSASNFMAVVLVARGASLPEFGVFALGYAFVTALVSITRAIVGTPLLLDADADERSLRTHLGQALVGGAATAVIGAAAVFGLVAAFGTPTSSPLAVLLALSAPVIVVHDLLRHGAAALGRPMVALVADVTWIAQDGEVTILCAQLPRDLLIVGDDEALVRAAARTLGVG